CFTAGTCSDHEVVQRIYSHAARAQAGVWSFDDSDRSRVSIRFTREDQDLVALRNENFAVHSIDSDGLRVLEPGVRTENFTHRRDVTVGVASESERSEEHTSELQSRFDLVCRLLLEKKKKKKK